MNSDDIHKRSSILKTIKHIEEGYFVRANRLNIDPKLVVGNDDFLHKLIDEDPSAVVSRELGESPNAGGDYLGLRKDLYLKSGGLRIAHGEWDLDNEFLNRCASMGIHLIRDGEHYHIQHYSSREDQHCNTPNRPPAIPGASHPLVGDLDKILNLIFVENGYPDGYIENVRV
jgi:hypothetical protein